MDGKAKMTGKAELENQRLEEPLENELLHRAKKGDFAAFQSLVSGLQPRVYGLAFRILHQSQDAEDVTQQTFMSMIEHIATFREESSVATWALKIATNHALKILRKRRTVTMVSMTDMTREDSYSDIPHPEFIAPWSQTAEEIAVQTEFRTELETALRELDDKYRLVFVLRDIEELSVRETAEALDLTESNVKVRLLRARLALRERLTKKFGDEMQVMIPDHKHS
jgi:RNA polymerase sigma-70 factor (ECF subfamily)